MGKKRICFVAQFPPPMHGLSKAVDTLYRSELAQEFEFEKIDIKNNKYILKALTAIRKSNADLFYFTIAQSIGGNLRDLMILKAIGDRPCLVHLHGGYYRTLVDKDMPLWQRKMNYNAIGKLAGAIVLGPSLKWIFKDMLNDEKIHIVPNCVDNEYLISEDDFEDKLRTINQRQVKHVLYLSNFIHTKGYPVVLEMARLEKEYGGKQNYHFDFAGKFFEETEEKFFWDYIKKYELEKYITYHGIVDGEMKLNLLKRCDVFVLPTTYPNEGQPISILEAMGNGMVIVTTDHAGIPDLVKDGVNGIVLRKDRIDPSIIYSRLDKCSFEETEITNRKTVEMLYRQEIYIAKMREVFLGL